jgi:hypothetical protein
VVYDPDAEGLAQVHARWLRLGRRGRAEDKRCHQHPNAHVDMPLTQPHTLVIGSRTENRWSRRQMYERAAALTIGITTSFLAPAPSSGPWRPEGFVCAVARFATPAGATAGVSVRL